jgi:putative drug exporter of the RND superfamily
VAKKLYALAHRCVRHRRWVIVAWLLILITSIGLSSAIGGTKSNDFVIPGTESQAANDLLAEKFPSQAGSAATIVFAAPDGGTLTTPEATAAITATMNAVGSAPQVISTSDPVAEQAFSPDGRVSFGEVRYPVAAEDVSDAAVEAMKASTQPATDAGLTVEFSGDVITAHSAETESHTAELIGLGVAVIVLMFAFGSLLAAITPIITGLVGVGITLMLLSIAARFLDVNEFGPTIATMIGLAVGIDYALFIVSRHRQNLRTEMSVEESIARACATAGSAVLFAGITVVIAISGLAVVGVPMLTSMGLCSALAVIIAVALALTLLPAVLGTIGTSIDRYCLPGMKPKVELEHGAKPTLSARWSRKVTAHPGRWLMVGLVIMGALAAPAFSMRLGIPDDGSQSSEKTERRAYDLLSEGFGPGFNGPFIVVADLSSTPDDQWAATLDQVGGQLSGIDGVLFAAPAISNDTGDTAIVTVFPTTGPASAETDDTLDRVRASNDDFTEGNGVELSVTGTTPINIDLTDRLTTALPQFMAIVIGLTFILLMIVFRSILVPLKAALAILISIVASIGVVVAVFQWGWGANLIGVSETLPMIAFLPVLMFAILFGLSMDYEVFILSRIREEHTKGLSNTDAVNQGLSATARIITAAALIMISVFSAFILTDDPTTKMFGLGLAVAVLLDATVVRMIMVPAAMVLMREGCWWLPKWMDRIIPDVDIEGAKLEQLLDQHPITDEREPVVSGSRS